MHRKKKILVAALCGALAGALGARLSGYRLVNIPGFDFDRAVAAHWQFVAAVSGWVLFSIYWEAAAKRVAAAQSSESRASRRLHVALTNVALLLEILPFPGLGRFLPAFSLTMTAGVGLEAAGLFLAVWARRRLGRYWSGEIAIKVEHELIRTGPYKLLRHPIYTGLLTMYAGTALVMGERLAIIGFAIAAFAYWRKIRLEEANLNVAFGANYDAYRRETWALLPGVF